MDKQLKLGEDVHEQDNLLDNITFADVILAVRCNEKVVDEKAVRRVVKQILETAMQDFNFLLDNNMDVIIKAVKEVR